MSKLPSSNLAAQIQIQLDLNNGSESSNNEPVLPFKVGHKPRQVINWPRRFDHMQQHTAQHLITAVALNHFHLPTVSWSLGPAVDYQSTIEIDSPELDPEEMRQLEHIVNEKIRSMLEVKISYREPTNLEGVRFHREVPEDLKGDMVRVITIGGGIDGGIDGGDTGGVLDRNTCCGTHVSNLAHLQAIKIIGIQKGKKGRGTNLIFMAGNRILESLGESMKRDRLLTQHLKCPAVELPSAVERTLLQVKKAERNSLSALRDLGVYDGKHYLAQQDRPWFYARHRRESNYDYITCFMSQVPDVEIEDRLLLLSVADDCLIPNSSGQILLAGKPDLVQKASDIACTQFLARGAVAHGKFRAKIPDVSRLARLEEHIREHIL